MYGLFCSIFRVCGGGVGWKRCMGGGGVSWKRQNTIIQGEGGLKLLKKLSIWYLNVPLSEEIMCRARTCEEGLAFMHILQSKAHLAYWYVMTWGLMSFYSIDRLGKNDWLVHFQIDQLAQASGTQLKIQF